MDLDDKSARGRCICFSLVGFMLGIAINVHIHSSKVKFIKTIGGWSVGLHWSQPERPSLHHLSHQTEEHSIQYSEVFNIPPQQDSLTKNTVIIFRSFQDRPLASIDVVPARELPNHTVNAPFSKRISCPYFICRSAWCLYGPHVFTVIMAPFGKSTEAQHCTFHLRPICRKRLGCMPVLSSTGSTYVGSTGA